MAVAPLQFDTSLPTAYSNVDFTPLARLGELYRAQQQQQQQQSDTLTNLNQRYPSADTPATPVPYLGISGSGAPSSGANYMHGQYGAPGQNLVPVQLASGKVVTVNAAAAPSFKSFLDELEKSGYSIGSLGGYNNRNIAGSSRLSQHAYGNAIDINPGANPVGSSLVTNLPPNIGEMAAKYGLSWGGNWKTKKDPMHFEWMGPR